MHVVGFVLGEDEVTVDVGMSEVEKVALNVGVLVVGGVEGEVEIFEFLPFWNGVQKRRVVGGFEMGI